MVKWLSMLNCSKLLGVEDVHGQAKKSGLRPNAFSSSISKNLIERSFRSADFHLVKRPQLGRLLKDSFYLAVVANLCRKLGRKQPARFRSKKEESGTVA